MNRGAWWATVHGVTKSQTRLKQLSMVHIINGVNQAARGLAHLDGCAGCDFD